MRPPYPTPPFLPIARTFVKRGFYMVCTRCSLAVEWCKCGPPRAQDTEPEEGEAAQALSQRILDVKR